MVLVVSAVKLTASTDPRSPTHRKQAFDLGDAGGGSCANNLALGCDCLGAIKYFSGWLNDNHGNPVPAENVICLHEQDGGIGWKHTNHRTGNPAITRARNLVVQSIITIGNYEYIWAWIFMQNGNLELETRATGIVSTSPIDPGKTSDWGTVVSPGVLAANHQHLFCMRIDPMIDGPLNTVIQEDSIAVPPSEHENPHGNAWRVIKTPIEKSSPADAAPFANRCFKIVNESILNPISRNPVGFKLVPQPCQTILAHKDSVARRRARFAEHHIWVTRYRDGDLWAGGKWTNQSLEEIDGVADYAARQEDVRNQDLVVWHTYGMTHNPRVEDFPVMPVEITTISLKPADFFVKNPAIGECGDVAADSNCTNDSQQMCRRARKRTTRVCWFWTRCRPRRWTKTLATGKGNHVSRVKRPNYSPPSMHSQSARMLQLRLLLRRLDRDIRKRHVQILQHEMKPIPPPSASASTEQGRKKLPQLTDHSQKTAPPSRPPPLPSGPNATAPHTLPSQPAPPFHPSAASYTPATRRPRESPSLPPR